MTFKNEAAINILIVLFAFFTAMFDPRISFALAIIFLVALAIYNWVLPPPKTR
jgi:hypothetical protein